MTDSPGGLYGNHQMKVEISPGGLYGNHQMKVEINRKLYYIDIVK